MTADDVRTRDLLARQVEREQRTGGQEYCIPGLLRKVLDLLDRKIAAAKLCEQLQADTPPKPKRRKRR